MTVDEIKHRYITVPEMRAEIGAGPFDIYNWVRADKFPRPITILGHYCLERETFEQWKREHPELIKNEETK